MTEAEREHLREMRPREREREREKKRERERERERREEKAKGRFAKTASPPPNAKGDAKMSRLAPRASHAAFMCNDKKRRKCVVCVIEET